jgi:hypothetical protein
VFLSGWQSFCHCAPPRAVVIVSLQSVESWCLQQAYLTFQCCSNCVLSFVRGKVLLFSTLSTPALRSTQPPIQFAPGNKVARALISFARRQFHFLLVTRTQSLWHEPSFRSHLRNSFDG